MHVAMDPESGDMVSLASISPYRTRPDREEWVVATIEVPSGAILVVQSLRTWPRMFGFPTKWLRIALAREVGQGDT